jgi:hypothetical protein
MLKFSEYLSESQLPLDYPLTKSALDQRGFDRFVAAIDNLQYALQGVKQINASGLKDIRSIISRGFEEAWTKHFSEPYFYNGRYKDRTPQEEELGNKLPTLVSIPSVLKKYAKDGSPVIQAGIRVVREYEGLYNALEAMKSGGKIKVGRIPDPSAPPKVVNVDQVRGTCGWCGRNVALKGNFPAHHGYQRPGEQVQTPSCPGVSYRCIEISKEGIEARLKSHVSYLKTLKDALVNLPNVKMLKYARKVIGPTDPNWAFAVRDEQYRLDYMIKNYEKIIKNTESELISWKPGVVKMPHKKHK